jgi:hypothetical protein
MEWFWSIYRFALKAGVFIEREMPQPLVLDHDSKCPFADDGFPVRVSIVSIILSCSQIEIQITLKNDVSVNRKTIWAQNKNNHSLHWKRSSAWSNNACVFSACGL